MGVCITGMHRTGTSLVAGLLQRHGLWLGDDDEMMPANPYNPDGYFENDRLVELDDAILALFGGSWSSPPDFPPTWTDDPRLAHIYKDARARGERLAAAGRPWGFKDPRAALTLPFWRSAWGELTVIVSLRNPLSTARSLNRRDDMNVRQGIALWSAYYRALLEHTTRATRVVVDYETLCADPVGTAGALLSRLPGLRDVDREVVLGSVRAQLRHFRATPADLVAEGVSSDVLDIYVQLRDEAIHGEVAGETASGNAPNAHAANAIDDIPLALAGLDLAIRDVHADLERLAAVVARLEIEIKFIRGADLAGISAQVEYERGQVDRIAQALPPLGDRLAATEAAIETSINGRRG